MTHDADLIDRLVRLGEVLDVDDGGDRLVATVLERVGDAAADRRPGAPTVLSRSRRGVTWHRVGLAAAAVAIVVLVVAVQPDARAAVARWFGLDGVTIVFDPDQPVRPAPTTFDLPGPGESRVVEVDGHDVLVSSVAGGLPDGLIAKTIGADGQIEEVDVDGRPGLWISGTPHDVLYTDAGGEVVIERVAGNTLLWQVDTVLYRVEGFDRLDDAIEFALEL